MSELGNATAAFFARSTGQMADLRRSAERLQEQVATGQRLARSSDDPLAAATLRNLARLDRLSVVDREATGRVASELTLASGALDQIANDLIRIRELATQAANGTLPSSARQAIGVEIAQLRAGIIAAANSSDAAGQPLFAGQSGTAPYLVSAAGDATYGGTPDAAELPLGGHGTTRGVTGPQFMTFASGAAQVDLPAFLKTLGDALQRGETLDPDVTATLDQALGNVVRTQTIVGARLAWLETVGDRQIAAETARAQSAADAGGVDLAVTIARLQQTLLALEAAQAGFARVSSLSLFDAI